MKTKHFNKLLLLLISLFASSSGAWAGDPVMVTISELETASVTCAGTRTLTANTTQLNANNAPFTYQWSTGETTESIDYVFDDAPVVIGVTVTDNFGMKYSNSYTVDPINPIESLPSFIAGEENTQIDFSIVLGNGVPLGALKFEMGEAPSWLAGTTYRTVPVFADTQIFGTVTDHGCSEEIFIHVYKTNSANTKIISGNGDSVCANGGTLLLSINHEGFSGDVVIWKVDGIAKDSLGIDGRFVYTYQGGEKVTAECYDDDFYSVKRATSSFTVRKLAKQSALNLTTPSAYYIGAQVDVPTSVTGGVGAYSYEWISASTITIAGSTATFTDIQKPDHCSVIVTDATGCNAAANFLVMPQLTAANFKIGYNNSPCIGDASFSMYAMVFNDIDNAAIYTHEWFLNDATASFSSKHEIPGGNYATGDKLKLFLSYEGHLLGEAATALTMNAAPNVSIMKPGSVEYGQPTVLSAQDYVKGSMLSTADGKFYWYSDPYGIISFDDRELSTGKLSSVTGPTYAYLNYTDGTTGCRDYDTVQLIPTGGPLAMKLDASIEGYRGDYTDQWNDRVCPGESVKLSVLASGGTVTDSDQSKYTFKWTSVPAGTYLNTASITVNPFVTTEYSVVVSDGTNTVTKSWQVKIAPPAKYERKVFQPTAYRANDGEIKISYTPSYDGAYCFVHYKETEYANNMDLSSLAPGKYYLKVENWNIETSYTGCSMDTIILKEFIPELEITDDVVSPCPGLSTGSIALTVNNAIGDIEYLWSDGRTSAKISALPAGEYRVTVTSLGAFGNKQSKEAAFEVLENTVIPLQPTLTKVSCNKTKDGSATFYLGDNSGINLQWQNGDNSAYVDTLSAGDYTVTVTDGNGCVSEVDFKIGAKLTPVVELGKDTSLCAGDIITLRAPTFMKGDENLFSYEWTGGSEEASLKTDVPGSYSVTVTSTDECEVVDNIWIGEVSADPFNICNVNILPSGAAEVSLNEYGYEYLSSYSIYRDGTFVQTVDAEAGRVFIDEQADANTAARSYTVKTQNVCGDISPLSYERKTPFVTGTRAGGNNELSWDIMTSASTIYIYRGTTLENMQLYDSTFMPNHYTDTLPLPKAYYRVKISSYMNCTDTIRTNTVLISVLPEIDFSVSDTIVGVGKGVEFVADVTKADAFVWEFEGGSVAKSSDNNVKQKYSAPGTYTVKLTAENPYGRDSLVRKNYITVVGIHERSAYACHGDSLSFSATAIDGATYTWSNGKTGKDIKILAEQSGQIGLKITSGKFLVPILDSVKYAVSAPISLADAATPCVGDSTEVRFTGFNLYKWNGGAETENPVFYITKENTKYSVWSKDAKGCESSDTLAIAAFKAVPVVNLGKDLVMCAGAEAVISVPYTAGITWSNNKTTPSINVAASGKYYVDVTENGCKASDTINVRVLAKPTVSSVGVTSDAQGRAGIFWEANGAFAQYAVRKETSTSGEYTTVGVVASKDSSYFGHTSANLSTNSGRYQIVAADTCGGETSIDASSIHLQVSAGLTNDINLSWTVPAGIPAPTYYIFRGATVADMTLFETISGSSQSLRDTHPVEGALYAIGVKANVPAKFLVGSWQKGYMLSNIAASGFTSPLPSVDFKANRKHVGVGSMVLFTSLTQKADKLNWVFEGGSPAKSTQEQVIVEYSTAGTYSVKLIAENADGKDSLIRAGYITVGGVVADSIRFIADTIKMKVGEFAEPQLSFYPFDTENKSVRFTSSSNDVFFVKAGTVYASGEGAAMLYAGIETPNGILIDSLPVSVKGFVAAKDIVLPYTIWMQAGERRAIAPVLVPFTLGTLDLVWTVSDTASASISPDGMLVAKRAGTIHVTATDLRSGISAAVPVVIGSEIATTSITIPAKMEIAAGWAYNISTEVSPAGANGQPITWTVSDESLVSVTADGVLKPVAVGTAYVVASIGTMTDTCYLTILPSKRPVVSTPATATVIEGTSKEMFILNMIEDDNTLPQNISWKFVSSTNVAVSQNISIMSMSAKSNASGTETIKVIAIDADDLTDTAEIAVTIVKKDTVPPVISLPTINILKGTKTKEINLLDYVKDDYTEPTFISTTVTGTVPSTTLAENLNILTITVANDAPLYSSSFTLTAKDDNDNSISAQIKINLTDRANAKPVLARIPNQEQVAGEFFSAVQLRTYVTDDYTLPADMQWAVSGMQQLSASVRNGRLVVFASDPTWTGSEQLTVTATDEQGASAQRSVWFTQLAAKPQAWPSKPEVSFKASTRYTVPGRAIDFYGSVNGSRQLYWEFEGADPATSTFTQPSAVYNTQGVYDVGLSSMNAFGKTVVTAENYITVIGIEQRHPIVCAGQTASLNAVAEGFTGYEWSTGEKTASISISPMKSAYYAVTITKGLTMVIDSVFVTVTNGLNLGADTVLCQGKSLRLGAEGYAEYYWNGSEVAGSAFINASEAATYTLFAKDAAGCQFNDTLVITEVLPSPQPHLGADQTLCDGELAALSAPGFTAYMWNTGAKTDAISVDTSGNYILTVTSKNGCTGIDTVQVTFKKPVVTNIGVVTISSTGKNLIAWERKRGQNIKAYQVFRETDATGEFEMIEEVPFDSLSVVIDQKSNPESKQEIYGIKTLDSCGNLSAMSPTHKPIFLQCTRTATGVNLSWDKYKVSNGELPYSTCTIYRGTTGGNVAPIATINNEGSSFTDNDPAAQGKVYYRVSILLKDQVVPKALKSDSGPFSQSMSNLAEAVALSDAETALGASFTVSPNPFIGSVRLSVEGAELSGARYVISDTEGIVFAEGSISGGSSTVDLHHLPAGAYIAKIITAEGVASKLLVKE